jgi:sugar phosphate isomerase/epimerase
MFWAGGDPRETIREVKSLGVRCGQLGIPGNVPLDLTSAAAWSRALEEEEFPLYTVFAAYIGEAYDDIPTVERTVGWIPPATRAMRLQRTFLLSDFAEALGVSGIALHVGFVPEERDHPDYVAVREMTRLVCDYAGRNGQTFALETGQEPAPVLRQFIEDVRRPNLRINFDPANMIMYGSGDPIEALGLLGSYVESVHAKDGDWPTPGVGGALGVEKPLGQGSVGMERFVAALREIGYQGPLHVEREGSDPPQRLVDIRNGVALLKEIIHNV